MANRRAKVTSQGTPKTIDGAAAASPHPAARSIPELLARYGCGPVQFSGDPNASYERHLVFDHVVAIEGATPRQKFEAIAQSLRDFLAQRWIRTAQTQDRVNPKQVYYLSMEFLIGRSL